MARIKKTDQRIPFLAAMEDEHLFKDSWEGISLPQQVVLKTLYGCPLSPTHMDDRGFTELQYWQAGQGFAEYTDLGFIEKFLPMPFGYVPKKYTEAWIIAGRRSGKSASVMSLIVAYEATCGGHEAYIRTGQEALCFQIAQDMRLARNTMSFIMAALDASPVLKKLVKNKTADFLELKNGFTIAAIPPSLRSVRGYANPCAVLDEVGVWYQDSDSANPDYEVYRAVKPGQAQFPNALLVGISSPWNKAGMLHGYMQAGTDGFRAPASERDRYSDCLVWHAPTAAMGNPLVTRRWLAKERDRDPKAFAREYLAVFQDSISGFLSPSLLRDAVDARVVERPPLPGHHYVAALDPAFRRDAFGFAICHCEKDRGIVFDLLRRWEGTTDEPVNPRLVVIEISELLKCYHIPTAYTDQYHLETLQQLALEYGFALEGVTFTNMSKAGIYGNLQQLLNQKRLLLLDEAISLRELRSLEKKMTQGGIVQIGAPTGGHDDLATVIALSADKAVWMLPQEAKPEPKLPTPHELIMAQMRRQQQAELVELDSDY